MFARIKTAGLFGVEGFPVEAEADAGNGLPGLYLTGALSPETREAQFRVQSAIKNSGAALRPKKVTVNLAPAARRKEGTAYDLAVLIAILCAHGFPDLKEASEALLHFAFLGEVGLDGSIKPVRGVLPMADALKKAGVSGLILPKENAEEAALVPGLSVRGIGSVEELFARLRDRSLFTGRTEGDGARAHGKTFLEEEEAESDFSEISGQRYLKRAAEIAVSGRHNLLFSGPAGTGKTMIARRLPSIMPRLSEEEALELTRLYSVCGLLPKGTALLRKRPFRAPHHSITVSALCGGGASVRPGEISLSSKGILFLDELPLFRREVIEALREPLEERRIVITRMQGSYVFPADFCLCAALNNCPCGFYPDAERCRCTPAQIRQYLGRLSKPILERIDLCAEALPLSFETLSCGGGKEESSFAIRARVEAAREIQKQRFSSCGALRFNGEMGLSELRRFCVLGGEEERFMRRVFEKKGLSARTYHKILRVARTIADMEGEARIRIPHLAEAAGYRGLEDRLFRGGCCGGGYRGSGYGG